MKFEEVFSFEHLLEAALECCNGVRWKSSTQVFESTVLMRVASLHKQLHSGTWKSAGFNRFTVKERGKVRNIQAVHISERAVQKCLVRYCLRPFVIPRLISDSYATLPGRGTEAAIAKHREHLRWWYARHGRDGSIAVMDYHDYFASIDHVKLKAMYARFPMDSKLFDLTCGFIDCFEGSSGIGLGSEVSQISAVLYVNPIDHLVKDRFGMHCYGRYMDDCYMIGSRNDVHEVMREVVDASAELGLVLNKKATTVRPLTQGWHYLKKRVSLTESGKIVMRLERENIKRERKRIAANRAAVAAGAMTLESAELSFQSWRSYASRYDAHRTIETVKRLHL